MPEEDRSYRTTAADNMHVKFCGVWTCGGRYMLEDKQSYRHACHNISLFYWGRSNYDWYRIDVLKVIEVTRPDKLLGYIIPVTNSPYWHCPCSMRNGFYETVGTSVRPSVQSIDSSSGGQRVCCWAPCRQEISIDSRRWRSCGQYHIDSRGTRLNTDLLEFDLGQVVGAFAF